MLSVYPSSTRWHERARSAGSVWHSLGPAGGPMTSFHGLKRLEENRLPPGTEAERRSGPEEVLTYVVEGTLAWEDERGGSGVLRAGSFQRSGRGAEHRLRESNASHGDWVSYFHIVFGPPGPGSAPHSQQHFTVASRRDAWRVVASPDGRDGSLQLDEDAVVSSVILEPGQHLVWPLEERRGVWLQLVSGRVRFGEFEFSAGDAVAISEVFSVAVTAKARTELLLIEVAANGSGGAT